MRIAICEDQVAQSDLLKEQIQHWAKEKDINVSVDIFFNAESFLFKWSDSYKYDIIFLDIKLNKMSGIELSNIIRERDKIIDIVFVTGFFKYALHGYKVSAMQYLMKPIKTPDLYFCLEKALERLSNKVEISKFVIKTTKKLINLDYNEIYCFIMFSPYIDIHTKLEKITLRKTITEVEDTLPKEYFIRCHRSYIINVQHIKSITKSTVLLSNGIEIPISRGKYKVINDAFINYISK